MYYWTLCLVQISLEHKTRKLKVEQSPLGHIDMLMEQGS